jgi:hypothetical protein
MDASLRRTEPTIKVRRRRPRPALLVWRFSHPLLLAAEVNEPGLT